MKRSSHSPSKFRRLMLPVALILASLVFVGGVLGSNLLHRSPALDKDTLCRKDVPLQYHTVLVVDATDAFTRDQAVRVRASVADERAALPKYGKLTMLFVTPNKPFEPEDILSLCNPGSGSEADPLLSNPGQIESNWRKQFAEPIDAAVVRLLSLPTAKRSPILETITAATWRYDFDSRISHRRLRIVSDLLQHEFGGYSHYQGGDPWQRFTRSALTKKVEADLTGVAVRIDYLLRPEAMQHQGEAHRKFWERWLTERGAASVDFSAPARPPLTLSKQPTKIAARPISRQGPVLAGETR
jgi:hypothetical protein